MGGSLSRKMLLRKKVDYQEECWLRRIYCKLFFKERTTLKSSVDIYIYRKSLLSLKAGPFRNEK